MNDDQLDLYFKKAREALSAPAPISDIEGRIGSSTGAGGNFWLQRRFQVLLVIGLAFLGLYFYEGYRNNSTEVAIEEGMKPSPSDNSAQSDGQDEEETQETAQTAQKESTSEDETPEVADVDQPKNLVEEVLPTPEDNATSRVQNEAVSQPQEIVSPESTTKEESSEDVGTEENEVPALTASSTKANDKAPPKTTSEPEPAKRDPALVTKETFYIKSEDTERDLRKLNKKLAEFGVKLTWTTLEYDREFIAKFKGELSAIESNKKVKITQNSIDFERLVLTFEYSINDGPQRMLVTGEQ